MPLTMPMTRTICSPASDSRNGRMTGMAPATAASYRRSTPAAAATSASSAPATASSALLAVTTGLPLRRAASISSWAGWRPTDDLDDDIDVGARHQCGGIGPQEARRDGDGPGPLRVGHGDPHQLQADARAGGDVLGAGEEDLGQCRPDIAAAEQPDAHGRRRVGVAAAALASAAVTSKRYRLRARRAAPCVPSLRHGVDPRV